VSAGRWAVVVAVPVVAYVVGAVALPRPQGVVAEQQGFDRSSLGPAVSTTPTRPSSPVDVTLGGVIALRGADLPDVALSRGKRFSVKLHFGVPAGSGGVVERDWQVFLHIDAQAGSYRIHGDHWPLRGQYKTSYWQKGEFIVDSWEGTVPMDAPAGSYDVWAGLYRGDDRMEVTAAQNPKVTDGEHRVRVGQLTVE
jgi:hypothetical protein